MALTQCATAPSGCVGDRKSRICSFQTHFSLASGVLFAFYFFLCVKRFQSPSLSLSPFFVGRFGNAAAKSHRGDLGADLLIIHPKKM
jgi:hypothetical protein